jgi:hypothetical protein
MYANDRHTGEWTPLESAVRPSREPKVDRDRGVRECYLEQVARLFSHFRRSGVFRLTFRPFAPPENSFDLVRQYAAQSITRSISLFLWWFLR